MWIHTKAALCDGRKRDPPLDLQPILAIIVECANWVTERLLVGSRMDHGDERYHERTPHLGSTVLRH